MTMRFDRGLTATEPNRSASFVYTRNTIRKYSCISEGSLYKLRVYFILNVDIFCKHRGMRRLSLYARERIVSLLSTNSLLQLLE